MLALALPVFLRASPYWTFVATMALLYVTIAQGLNLRLGSAGVINLAGAAFSGLGGYTVGLLTLAVGLPPWLAVVGGPLVAMAVGAVLLSSRSSRRAATTWRWSRSPSGSSSTSW